MGPLRLPAGKRKFHGKFVLRVQPNWMKIVPAAPFVALDFKNMEKPMKTVTIYTDGACSGNPGPGGWGRSVK